MLTALGNINLILRRRSTGSITSAQLNLKCNCFTDFTCRAPHEWSDGFQLVIERFQARVLLMSLEIRGHGLEKEHSLR